ncbi:MAG: hypothetical protein HRT44_03305 [Bdellovibrionales bacterium]|nr:hypothetical protein [Bdellovibrionales bacterium]
MALQLKSNKALHLKRKLFHMSGIMVAYALMNYLTETQSWMVYMAFGIPFIFWDFARQKVDSFNRITLKYFGGVLRDTEENNLSGVTFAILGLGISFFLFPKIVVLLAVLFLAIGDPVASFFGVLYGQDKIIGNKSLQGSLAAFAFCSAAGFFFFSVKGIMLDHLFLVSFLSGIIAAIAELMPVGRLDDNFTQLLMSSSLLTILFSLFGAF